MNLEEFLEQAERLNLSLPTPGDLSDRSILLSNEALFQLPLLALVILFLASGKSKPRASELGQRVGECLEGALPGFKGSSQELGWSSNLRIRTVKALSFLELANLCVVDASDRRAKSTALGRQVIQKIRADETSDLALTLARVERHYDNLRREKQISENISS